MRSEFEVLFQTSTVTACMIAWAWATVTDIFSLARTVTMNGAGSDCEAGTIDIKVTCE